MRRSWDLGRPSFDRAREVRGHPETGFDLGASEVLMPWVEIPANEEVWVMTGWEPIVYAVIP